MNLPTEISTMIFSDTFRKWKSTIPRANVISNFGSIDFDVLETVQTLYRYQNVCRMSIFLLFVFQ